MLDVYPLSASFPNGTDGSYDPYDSVHYKDSVFKARGVNPSGVF